jgi:hypothetical protein
MRLTAKGERWLINIMGYGSAALLIVTFFALWGLAGWVEGL